MSCSAQRASESRCSAAPVKLGRQFSWISASFLIMPNTGGEKVWRVALPRHFWRTRKHEYGWGATQMKQKNTEDRRREKGNPKRISLKSGVVRGSGKNPRSELQSTREFWVWLPASEAGSGGIAAEAQLLETNNEFRLRTNNFSRLCLLSRIVDSISPLSEVFTLELRVSSFFWMEPLSWGFRRAREFANSPAPSPLLAR